MKYSGGEKIAGHVVQHARGITFARVTGMAKGVLSVLLVLLYAGPIFAEEVVVGVKPAAPFVIVAEDGSVGGFSIDLVEHLASQMDNVKLAYRLDPDLPSHLSSVINQNVDFGIAATTITSEREKTVDFSHPFFESSIGILTLKVTRKKFLQLLFTKEIFLILLGVLAYMTVCGHIIWFIERGYSFGRDYLKGIGRGMWWTIVTMSTVGYGDVYPERPAGRLFGAFVIMSGIALFGLAIAGLSSMFTVSQLTPAIRGAEDLIGQPVAVIKGTQTVKQAEVRGMNPVVVGDLDEGVDKLLAEEVLAVVHDTPILQYYIKKAENPKITMAENTFSPSYYGITFPKGSALRERVNIVLMQSFEDGSHQKLKQKWFGMR